MKPALSVVFFTVSSGAGLGLLIWATLARLLQGPLPGFEVAVAMAAVLFTTGLLSSGLHLANPRNGWRACMPAPISLPRHHAGPCSPEVAPLVTALNGLFERMTELLESERRFTADAAHELRTPIAAIRMQVQVAQEAPSDAGREQALAATLQGCDRAARLVEQLLQLARLESEASYGEGPARPGPSSADMAAIARALVAEFERQVTARGQRLVLDAAAAVPSPLPAALAQVLMRNLIDNAVRYSPDGALVRISVGCSPEGGAGRLVVEDGGPGLTPDAMARLGERFFRVVGSPQTGSGLGWSIVRRLARLFELDLVVDRSAALGGLRVTVSWKRDGRVHQA